MSFPYARGQKDESLERTLGAKERWEDDDCLGGEGSDLKGLGTVSLYTSRKGLGI